MKPDHVKQLLAILHKAWQSGWITEDEAVSLGTGLVDIRKKTRKKVKSPELGT